MPVRQIANQYSYVVAGTLAWLVLAIAVARWGVGLRWRLAALAAAPIVLAAAWLLLRPATAGPTDGASLEAALASSRAARRPVLLEVYSDY